MAEKSAGGWALPRGSPLSPRRPTRCLSRCWERDDPLGARLPIGALRICAGSATLTAETHRDSFSAERGSELSMLVQFSVKNYRSFNEPETLSLVAAPELDHGSLLEENTFVTANELRLVKSAAIYGANASGKSNLVRAITFVRTLILSSFSGVQPDAKLDVAPFRLRIDTINQPSEFSIIWIDDGELFRYQFSLDTNRIHEEYLYRTLAPTKQNAVVKEEELFHRSGLNVRIGSGFTEGHDLPPGGFKRENALFLSYAAQFAGPISNKVTKWISWQIRPISGLDDRRLGSFTATQLADQRWANEILRMSRRADFGIERIRAEERQYKREELPKDIPEEAAALLTSKGGIEVITTRQVFDQRGTPAGETDFNLRIDESEGTRKFVSLSAPLIDVLENARVLVIDEFDARLHPVLSRAIIELFHSPANQNNAQLIFATHDTNLLDSHLLRRDQIWFTEKDKIGGTNLYSLAAFQVGESANVERDYIQGKFGAIPYIRPLLSYLAFSATEKSTEK